MSDTVGGEDCDGAKARIHEHRGAGAMTVSDRVDVREEWDERRGLTKYFVDGELVKVYRHRHPPYFLSPPPMSELREMVDKLNLLIDAIALPPVLRGTVKDG